MSALAVIGLVALVLQGQPDENSIGLIIVGVFAVIVFVFGRVVRYVLAGE